MKNENYFYLGQTVYNFVNEKGSIVRIKDSGTYIIEVVFENSNEPTFYTFDGRLHTSAPISLFQQPITLPTNKPIIKVNKGDLVWVKDYEETQWECRYFSHFSDFSRTKAVCFIDQKESGDLKEWLYYSEFENIPF
jgi:hypothetical protein